MFMKKNQLESIKLKIKKYLYNKKTFLFLISLIIYMINFRPLGTGDTITNVYVAISLIKEHNFDLNEFKDYNYGVVEYNNKKLPIYPVLTPIISAPFLFLPEVFFHISRNLVVEKGIIIANYLGKSIATFLTSLSVIFIYSSLKLLTKEKYALFITMIYAFATPVWTICSQGLWSHTTVVFFLSIAVYFFVRGQKDKKYITYAALPLTLAFLSRPPVFFILLIMSFYVLFRFRALFKNFMVLMVPPLLFLAVYNHTHFGSIISSGYSRNPYYFFVYMRGNFLEGFLGQLISPSRGIFIYSPILIFSLYGMYKYLKDRNTLFIYFLLSIFSVIFIYSYYLIWYGGHSFGNRYITDVMPLLILFLVPSFDLMRSNRLISIVFYLLLGFSVFVQFEGAFIATGIWHSVFNIDSVDTSGLWSWENNQIIYELLHNEFKIPFNEFLEFLSIFRV